MDRLRSSLNSPWLRLATLLSIAALSLALSPRPGPATAQDQLNPKTIRIDLRHILEGRVNSRGNLVGVHHLPSAPKTMDVNGKRCDVEFELTSPGGPRDVRTARVRLMDPRSNRVVLEKFSTLYPEAWNQRQIESSIREAFADALKNKTLDDDGRWQGKTRDGLRIDGFLSYDGTFIASAFPVYIRPRNDRGRR